MKLEEAKKIIDDKEINEWMAYGIIKWNDGYCIVDGSEMKRHPDFDLIYLKKGIKWKVEINKDIY